MRKDDLHEEHVHRELVAQHGERAADEVVQVAAHDVAPVAAAAAAAVVVVVIATAAARAAVVRVVVAQEERAERGASTTCRRRWDGYPLVIQRDEIRVRHVPRLTEVAEEDVDVGPAPPAEARDELGQQKPEQRLEVGPG